MNESKQRHGCVNAWLWFAIIANLGYAIYGVFLMFNADIAQKSLGYGLLTILSTINVLGSILLLRWNKLGFYLFIISSIAAATINISIFNLQPILLISGVIAILIWWGILQIGKEGKSAWSLLEDGVDYKHCRHLYQLFGIIIVILLALTVMAYYNTNKGSYEFDYTGEEEIWADSTEVDTIPVMEDIVWENFSDKNNACSIEAPNDFHTAILNDSQILGLICTDYDPAIIVITEKVNSLKSAGITTTKDYANVLVKMNRNIEGVSDFHKISEENYGDDSYLIVYNLSIDGTKFRYNLLTSRTKENYYYCQVYCLEEYADNLQPTMTHMLSSFKAIK